MPKERMIEKSGVPIKTIKGHNFMYESGGIMKVDRDKRVPLKYFRRFKRGGKVYHSRTLLKSLPINVRGSGNKSASATFICRYPLKVGSKPAGYRIPTKDYYLAEACGDLSRVKALDGVRFTDNFVINDYMALGGWATTQPHLNEMATHGKREVGYAKSARVLDYLHELDLPKLKTPLPSDVYLCPMKTEAGNGGDFSAYGAKGRVAGTIYAAAEKLLKKISKTPTPDVSCYSIGARDKRNLSMSNGEILKARVVINQDSVECAAAKPYCQLFENHFELCREENPIFIGNSMTHFGYLRYARKLIKAKFSLDDDIKGFDASVYKELLVVAFSILRSCFREGIDIDNVFYHFVYGVVYKRIVTPDGLLYMFEEGFPSGTAWTSILGSVVNWVLLKDCLIEYSQIFWHSRMPDITMSIYGDDFVLHFNDWVCFNESRFRDLVESRHGFVLKGQGHLGKGISDSEEEVCSFLKTCINTKLEPFTKTKDILERVKIPARVKRTSSEFMLYIMDQMKGTPNSEDAIELVTSMAASMDYYKAIEQDKLGGRNAEEFISDMKEGWREALKHWISKVYLSFSLKRYVTVERTFKNNRDYYHPYEKPRIKHLVNRVIDMSLVRNWFFDNSFPTKMARAPTLNERASYLSELVGSPITSPSEFWGDRGIYDHVAKMDFGKPSTWR